MISQCPQRPFATAPRGVARRAVSLSGLAAAMVAASLLLAACGGSSSSSSLTSSALTKAEVEDASGNISVVGWQFLDEPKVQDAGNVKSTWTYLGTEKDIYTKARSGQYDVLNATAATIEGLKRLNVLHPINVSLLSDYDELTPVVRDDAAWTDNGHVVAVPFAVSPSFTAWNSKQVPEPQTLEDLLKPVYKSSIGLVGDPSVIEQIATAQGVKNTAEMTEAQLNRVMAYLEKLKPNVKTFYQFGEEAQLFARGEVKVLLQGSGSYLSKVIETVPSVKFNFLAENSYVEAWTLNSGQQEAASLNWINRTLSQSGQEAIVKASEAYPVNTKALGALVKVGTPVAIATAKLSLPEILKNCPPARGFSPESHGNVVGIEKVTRAWDDYQSSF
jgi:spermidine/putrescine-binding protein